MALRYGAMDAPPSLEVSTPQPLLGRALRALSALDGATRLALVCVVFGWFFMNTLVVNLGSLQHGVRFFDMSAIIADPTRMFFGVDAPFHRFFFGLACLACLAAPLAAYRVKQHSWLFYLAPLALMIACGVLLYSRSSGEFFAAPADPKSVGGAFIHFANDLVRRGSDLVSRHIAVGAGGYLALIGSTALAVHGIRRCRQG